MKNNSMLPFTVYIKIRYHNMRIAIFSWNIFLKLRNTTTVCFKKVNLLVSLKDTNKFTSLKHIVVVFLNFRKTILYKKWLDRGHAQILVNPTPPLYFENSWRTDLAPSTMSWQNWTKKRRPNYQSKLIFRQYKKIYPD